MCATKICDHTPRWFKNSVSIDYEFNLVVQNSHNLENNRSKMLYLLQVTDYLPSVNLHAAETMICVCHLLGPRHGLDHLDIRLWMNGGLGPLTTGKLLGT